MDNKNKRFYKILNEMDEKERFEKFMLFMLAPVVAGFKPSSTITLVKGGKDYIQWKLGGLSYLEKLGLRNIVLRESENAVILLIYNEGNLKSRVYKKENYDFLTRLNYDLSGDLDMVLIKLKERYEVYHCPHELGIFLGIPTEDVKDFMNCTEKKCLACGYWKVFNNYDEAIKVFNAYDESKENVVSLIIQKDKTSNIIDKIIKKYSKKAA